MSINEKSLSAGSFVLNASIAIMAIAIAGREIRDWRSNQDSQPAPPVFDPEWRTAVGAATAISNPSAKVTLVEFLDFECPVCQQTHGVIGALARKYSARLSIAYVHFPLKNHKYARLGAFAVECSKRYGKLPEAMDAVFRDQVHLARFSAGAFARGVGIADSVGFVACLCCFQPAF